MYVQAFSDPTTDDLTLSIIRKISLTMGTYKPDYTTVEKPVPEKKALISIDMEVEVDDPDAPPTKIAPLDKPYINVSSQGRNSSFSQSQSDHSLISSIKKRCHSSGRTSHSKLSKSCVREHVIGDNDSTSMDLRNESTLTGTLSDSLTDTADAHTHDQSIITTLRKKYGDSNPLTVLIAKGDLDDVLNELVKDPDSYLLNEWLKRFMSSTKGINHSWDTPSYKKSPKYFLDYQDMKVAEKSTEKTFEKYLTIPVLEYVSQEDYELAVCMYKRYPSSSIFITWVAKFATAKRVHVPESHEDDDDDDDDCLNLSLGSLNFLLTSIYGNDRTPLKSNSVNPKHKKAVDNMYRKNKNSQIALGWSAKMYHVKKPTITFEDSDDETEDNDENIENGSTIKKASASNSLNQLSKQNNPSRFTNQAREGKKAIYTVLYTILHYTLT